MKVPDWFDPGQVDVSDSASPPRGYPPNVVRCLRVRLPGAPLRHSDVLTTPGWMGPRDLGRWITFPGNDFCRRKSFIDLSATARFGPSISTTSVAIELDQPLVADSEVMRDLVEHDMPDFAA